MATKVKVAASLTVYRVADMTVRGRGKICDWLRSLADNVQFNPQLFAKTFRARYRYVADKKGTPP